MTGFMNAEIEAIRLQLPCGHCGCKFEGTPSQARHFKYDKRICYCSEACRLAGFRSKTCTPIPNRGPCKTCGKAFFSRSAKVYCGIKCYVASDQFRAMQRENMEKRTKTPEALAKLAATLRTGTSVPCLECGVEFYRKPSLKSKKFCRTICYRSYMAKRFDRWIANPESLALPECYDEFLDKQELKCIVGDCDWSGSHLSLHVNQAHGLKAADFKRAAGFNIHSGIIARPLAELLQARPLQGVATEPVFHGGGFPTAATSGYRSKEATEHRRKARSLLGLGPIRTCQGCGIEFRQSTPMGRKLYHSIECRDAEYSRRLKQRAKKRVRQADGTFKWMATEDTTSTPESG